MRPKIFRQQLAALQSVLAESLGHLAQAPGADTLHALRVGLRRLRALLRPLAGRKAFAPLYAEAGAALEVTSPLRDLEVLAEDLARHRRRQAAVLRRKQFQQALPALLSAPPLRRLETQCRPRPPEAPAIALPDRDALAKRCRKTVERDRERLQRRLAEPAPDLHRLRLDIKRLRYQLEGQDIPGMRKELRLLAAAQALLGDWHDRALWLAQAETEQDLQPCIKRWQLEQGNIALQLPATLNKLKHLLDDARD